MVFGAVTRAILSPSRSTRYAVTATLSLAAFHARSTSDREDDVTWRFFGVEGGVVSAAAAGVDATTDRMSRSATIAPATNDLLRNPRPLMARKVLRPRAIRARGSAASALSRAWRSGTGR